ncbi:MAG: LysR family transcriptional regulator [Pseudomonadota bacterium]
MKHKFSLDDLQLFQLVVQHGGINSAAAESKIPPATLSRRLKALELALGGRLLERSAHHFALTEMGRLYYSRCTPLLDDLQAITATLEEDQHRLGGQLKVTAPVSMSQRWLGQCFFEFMKRYPQIQLELVLSNQYENLLESQFDVAVRVGEPQDSSWIARYLCSTHMGLCASSSYLANAPPIQHPRDLATHRLIVAEPLGIWDLRHTDSGEELTINPQPSLRTNDFMLAVKAVTEDLGVSLVPDYYYADADGANTTPLQAVLPEWKFRKRSVYLIYRNRNVMSARLRVFIEFVLAWMPDALAEQGHGS